jgi:hypothetical protein
MRNSGNSPRAGESFSVDRSDRNLEPKKETAMSMRFSLASTALLVLASVARAQHSDPTCPDVRATQVDAHTENGGATHRCGLGFKLFGLGGGLFGPECPERTFTYPSHQECNGDYSPGTRCVPEGDMQVTAKECHCDRATIFGTGLLLPSCSCHETNDGGEVEDAETILCAF